ncbi:MAG: hypothetical protein WC953_09720 [Pseudomonas sp.]
MTSLSENSRHCEERSDAAIQGLGTGVTHWIAAPSARNDGGGKVQLRATLPHFRHCEERSDVAIHGLGAGVTHWIAAPSARNDGGAGEPYTDIHVIQSSPAVLAPRHPHPVQ